MALKVIDSHPGYLENVRERFGDSDSHQEGTHEARALGHGDRFNALEPISGPGQRLCYNRKDDFDVPAGRKLGNDSAILAV